MKLDSSKNETTRNLKSEKGTLGNRKDESKTKAETDKSENEMYENDDSRKGQTEKWTIKKERTLNKVNSENGKKRGWKPK